MTEELSLVNTVLLFLVLLLFAVFVRTVYKFKKELAVKVSALENDLNAVEKETASLKSLVNDVNEELKQKIDSDYLDKRIDGLVKLIRAK